MKKQRQLQSRQTIGKTADLLSITRFLHDVATVGLTIEKLLRFWRLIQQVIWRHSKHLDDLHYLVKLQQGNNNRLNNNDSLLSTWSQYMGLPLFCDIGIQGLVKDLSSCIISSKVNSKEFSCTSKNWLGTSSGTFKAFKLAVLHAGIVKDWWPRWPCVQYCFNTRGSAADTDWQHSAPHHSLYVVN